MKFPPETIAGPDRETAGGARQCSVFGTCRSSFRFADGVSKAAVELTALQPLVFDKGGLRRTTVGAFRWHLGAVFLLVASLVIQAMTGNAAAATRPTDSSAWNSTIRNWRNKLDANDPGMKEGWFGRDVNDSAWKTMSLPRHHEKGGLPGHDGTVWFRRTVELSEARAAGEHLLELGPIDDMDMAWVNGVQVGGIEVPGYWLKPRSYKVPAKLLRPGRNVIAVRVIDHGWSGGFAGSARQMKLSLPGRSPISLYGTWSYRAGVTLKSLGLGGSAQSAETMVAVGSASEAVG